MKRKLSRILVMTMIVCMSVLTLTACSGGKDTDEPVAETDNRVNTVTMLKDVINNMKATFAGDKEFGIDVEVKFIADDKTDTDNDAQYQLSLKGNVDFTTDALDNATDFVLEFNKIDSSQSKETLLGIAYEFIEGKPYFFINLLNGGYEKIEGYSLLSLYNITSGSLPSGGGFDITNLIAYIAPIVFGKTGTVENGVYTFDFDLANTVGELDKVSSLLTGALNLTQEEIDALVAKLLGGITYTVSGVDYTVDSWDSLITYLTDFMSFKGKLVLNFDKDNRFTTSQFSFDYTAGNDSANYQMNVEKAFMGIVSEPIDTFKDFQLSADERKENQAHNLLNFSMSGKAVGYDKKGAVVHNYSIDVQADLNPFVLFDIINNTSKENVLQAIEKLGYFHLEINELNDNGSVKANVITIHTKTEEGFAVVNVDAYKAILFEVGLGGVYDFDALYDVIDMLTATEGSGNGGADSQLNVGSLLIKMLGYFDIDNVSSDGVTVELKNLVFTLADTLGLDTSGLVATGINSIVGSDYMNIKLNTPIYGTCSEVDTSSIKGGIRKASGFKKGKTDLIKEIVSLDGFTGKIFEGDDQFNNYTTGAMDFNKAFTIKGKNLADQTVMTSGYIMAVKGFDKYTVGTQNVTLYIAIANDMLDLAGVGLAVDDMIPLSGVLKFQTDIEVLPYDQSAEVSLSNIKTDNVILVANDTNLFDSVRISKSSDAFMLIDGGQYKLNASDMVVLKGLEDVTDKVLDENGNITVSGSYSVRFNYGLYTYSVKIQAYNAVDGRLDILSGNEVTSLALGEIWNPVVYQLVAIDKDGNETILNAVPEYRIGTEIKTLDQIFDNKDGAYMLKKDLSFVGSDFKIRYSMPTNDGKTKTLEKTIRITSEYELKSAGSTVYFGNSMNDQFVLNVSGVPYNVIWDSQSDSWIAKNAENETVEITLTLSWDATKQTVELNGNGVISNPPNTYKNGRRNSTLIYSFEVNGYYANGSITYEELYAGDKTGSFGGIKLSKNKTFDSFMYYEDKIYYEVKGEQVKLEFRYDAGNGYGLYYKDSGSGKYVKACDVTVTATVWNTTTAVELTDGMLTEAGMYKVEYELTLNGINQKFYNKVQMLDA